MADLSSSTVYGDLSVQRNLTVLNQIDLSNAEVIGVYDGKITISTSSPSGGSDGDLWFVV